MRLTALRDLGHGETEQQCKVFVSEVSMQSCTRLEWCQGGAKEERGVKTSKRVVVLFAFVTLTQKLLMVPFEEHVKRHSVK